MLLPIVTTSAAFPLFNRVLAANLQPLLPLPLRSKRTAAVICALPPLLLTACIRDTALVFSLCGLAGFCIVWFVPAALQHAAMRASVRRWGEAGRLTPHSTSFSGPFTVVAVAAVGGIAFAYNLWVVVVAPVVARLVFFDSRDDTELSISSAQLGWVRDHWWRSAGSAYDSVSWRVVLLYGLR